jgi:hypothetical protein
MRARALAGVLLLASAAQASGEEARVNLHLELGPGILLAQPVVSSVLHVAEAGLHVRLAVEYQPHERVGVEAFYSPDVWFYTIGGGADPQQHFGVGVRVRPWYQKRGGWLLPTNPKRSLAAGDFFSDVWLDAHFSGVLAADRNRIAYDVGVGGRVPVRWPVQLGLFVRFEQQFPVSAPSENTFKQLLLGVTVSAGFLPVHPAPDEDHDGVPDADDRCPGTPRGTVVNEWGCPRDVPRAKTPPSSLQCSDTDLDGVCDGEDRCPDTPLGTKVDKHGCPIAPAPSESPAE